MCDVSKTEHHTPVMMGGIPSELVLNHLVCERKDLTRGISIEMFDCTNYIQKMIICLTAKIGECCWV